MFEQPIYREVVVEKLSFGKRSMDLAVTDLVHPDFDLALEGFRNKMVFVNVDFT